MSIFLFAWPAIVFDAAIDVLRWNIPPASPVIGAASWYGEEFRGKPQANGEPYDPDAMTCAYWRLPFGTRLRIQHGEKEVIVTVTDRGPGKYRDSRLIDLSRAAFAALAPLEEGIIKVTVTPLP
jgi:rare lipoprotein A